MDLKERNWRHIDKDTQDVDFHPLLLQIQNPKPYNSEKWMIIETLVNDNRISLVPSVLRRYTLRKQNSEAYWFQQYSWKTVKNTCCLYIHGKPIFISATFPAIKVWCFPSYSSNIFYMQSLKLPNQTINKPILSLEKHRHWGKKHM